MKKFIVVTFCIVGLLLNACGPSPVQSSDNTSPFTSLKAAYQELYPTVMDANTGTYWQRKPGTPIADGIAADYWVQLEPPTRADLENTLTEWGFNFDDEVQLLMLDADFTIEADGTVVVERLYTGMVNEPMSSTQYREVASLDYMPPMVGPTPGDCRAFAIHLVKRVVVDGVAWTTLTGLLARISNNTISPTVLKSNSDQTSVVAKYVYDGISFVLLMKRGVGPTLIGPINAMRVGTFLDSLTSKLLPGAGKGITVMEAVSGFMACVVQYWPKNQQDIDQAKKDHAERYKRDTGDIPEDFPKSIPVPPVGENNKEEIVLLPITAGQLIPVGSDEYTPEELTVLIATGIVVVVVILDPIPGDEVVIPTVVTYAYAYAH